MKTCEFNKIIQNFWRIAKWKTDIFIISFHIYWSNFLYKEYRWSSRKWDGTTLNIADKKF